MDPPARPILDTRLFELYRKKSLTWNLRAGRVRLDLPADVFSSFQIDTGTRALARQIAAARPRWNAALDLGCGYGPLCLFLAAEGLADRVDAVDRDALALAFARHNAEAHGAAGVDVRAHLAYDGLPEAAYDAVVCNLPAKAGPGVHRLILLGAARHLTPGGEVWVVVVRPLAERIDEILAAGRADVRGRAARKGHVVYRYALPSPPPAVGERPYVRAAGSFTWRKHEYRLTCLHGLGEFDSRAWVTDALLGLLATTLRTARGVGSLMCCEPSQGHLPVLAARMAPSVQTFHLVSRDLLALRAAGANLQADGFDGHVRRVHAADFEPGRTDSPPQIATLAVREKEGLDVNAHKLHRLLAACPNVRVLVGCRSGFASRLTDRLQKLGHRCSPRRKRKGLSAFCVT